MDPSRKQLPALRKTGLRQRATSVSIVFSAFLIVLEIFALTQTFSAIAMGEPIIAVIQFAIFLFMGWRYGGILIETYLALNLVKQFQTRNYGATELSYHKMLQLWHLLPIRKGASVALAYSNFGLVRLLQGKFDAAEAPLRESVRLMESDRRAKKHFLSAIPINNLAIVCARTGNLDEAESLATRALKIYENHKKTKTTCGPAFPLIVLGWVHEERGKFLEAEECFERAYSLLSHEKSPAVILKESIEQARITCKLNLAYLYLMLAKQAQAEELCAELLHELSVSDEFFTVNGLRGINHLVPKLIENNQTALAEQLLEHAYFVARHHPDHPDAKILLNTYASLLETSGRTAEIADLNRWVRPVLLSTHLIAPARIP